jgi:hypothetical protein
MKADSPQPLSVKDKYAGRACPDFEAFAICRFTVSALRISSSYVFIFPASSHLTVFPDPRVAAMLLSVLVIVTISGVSICATKGG